MTTKQRLGRFLVSGGALALLALVVYAALAPAHVVDGDNAELTTVGAIGGRPHPSGYPAYVLYLRATSWLPGSTPAHTAALATALLAAALVYVLHAACRAWGARPLAATAAVALYAASPVVLRMHTEAEVFAMNGLVVAAVLWLSAANGPLRGLPRVAALALVAGLGLGDHLTCVLAAPVGVLGVVRGFRESTRPKVLVAAAGIGALGLALSTYAYLWLADGPVSFGRIDRFSDVVAFFLREDYGGAGAFVPGANRVSALTNLGALLETLGRGWLWLPAVAGLGMLGVLAVRPGRAEPAWGWRMLAVSWLLAGPVLALRFNIAPVGLGLYVCQRFHLLPLLLLAVPVALAFDRAGEAVAPRITTPLLRKAGFGTGLALVVFLGLTATSLPWLRAVHSPAMELGVRNILRSLPEHAVVVGNSEDLCFGADYLQYARGERPDVDVACWIVTSRTWYRDRLARRGVRVVGAFSLDITPEQARAILASGRPLFVDRSQKATLGGLASYPYGALVRILGPGEAQPSVPEVVALNQRLLARFDLDYPRPHRGDDYAAVAHKRYAATWVTLASALEAIGDKDGAAAAMDLAARLAPAPD